MKRVINCTKIKSSKNFENKILKFFPRTEDKDIYLDSVGIRRKGTGSYEIYLDIFIGRFQRLTFTEHTNSSPLWDWYADVEDHERAYQNWAKSTVLELLENNKEQITEFYFEEELEANI
jgi:hypothetical protein